MYVKQPEFIFRFKLLLFPRSSEFSGVTMWFIDARDKKLANQVLASPEMQYD
jgi:hypothetical protein